MHQPSTGSLASAWGGPAALWAASLAATSALGVASARALGPAAGFLVAVAAVAAGRAGFLPPPVSGLLPPAAGPDGDLARAGAAVLAAIAWLTGAAALRPR